MIGRYEFDTLWVYDFDMVLLCFWYDMGYGVGIFGMFWMWCDFDMVWIWFIWFWYGLGTKRLFQGSWRVGFKKGNGNSPGTAFWSISRGFLCFWYDFAVVLIRFWYGFDMVLIRFWIWFRWVGFKSQVWPASRIITETISKSYLKPYQHHKCKTMPETIHNNKSYLKRITIKKKYFEKLSS